MSIRIITDSTVDADASYTNKFSVVPLTVSFGEKDYSDGVDLSKQDFYRMLETGDVLPKTSQAPPDTFARIYRELRDKGDEAIVITVSSRLSGTFQSALIAAEGFPNVRVVDSRNVSIGDDVCLLARLDTLEYLKKGGRISKTTAFAGGVLNIKPVVTVKDGDVVFLGKARGSRKANNFLVEQINLNGIDYAKPVLLGYTGTSDEMLREYISESRDLWEGKVDRLCCEQLCSVIGTHAGPGGVAVAFFRSSDTAQ